MSQNYLYRYIYIEKLEVSERDREKLANFKKAGLLPDGIFE